MYTKQRRIKRGVAIAEAAAALTLLLPLAVLIIFVVAETGYAFFIKSTLSHGARQAARDLAIAYGRDPSVASSRSAQDAQAFDHVRVANMITASEQFEDPVFNEGETPHTVKVKVRYLGGQYGLPPFPNPDPLKLGPYFQIFAESTYRLE